MKRNYIVLIILKYALEEALIIGFAGKISRSYMHSWAPPLFSTIQIFYLEHEKENFRNE